MQGVTEGHISIPINQIPMSVQAAMLSAANHGKPSVLKLTIRPVWVTDGFSVVSEHGKETTVEFDFYGPSIEVDFGD